MSLPVVALSGFDIAEAKKIRARVSEIRDQISALEGEKERLTKTLKDLLEVAAGIKTAPLVFPSDKVAHISDDGKYVVVTDKSVK